MGSKMEFEDGEINRQSVMSSLEELGIERYIIII